MVRRCRYPNTNIVKQILLSLLCSCPSYSQWTRSLIANILVSDTDRMQTAVSVVRYSTLKQHDLTTGYVPRRLYCHCEVNLRLKHLYQPKRIVLCNQDVKQNNIVRCSPLFTLRETNLRLVHQRGLLFLLSSLNV